jgi:hypothetical protein
MIACQLDSQDWRLPSMSTGAHGHLQEIKSGFIYPDDRGVFLVGFF